MTSWKKRTASRCKLGLRVVLPFVVFSEREL
jgi:hypothetical protein